MLTFEVEFLTGRYVATAFDDRSGPEWPPHPARLFSALAATHFESEEQRQDERAALEWLEQQGPPEIAASEAFERVAVTVYVPVNDVTVVGSFDREEEAVAEARRQVELQRGKSGRVVAASERRLARAEASLQRAIGNAIARPEGAESKGGPARAESLLPERRTRQPRMFPSVTPAETRVSFSWPTALPTPEQRSVLEALAARMVRLGHSSSLVAVRSIDERREASWVPDVGAAVDSISLRVFAPGQLAALCSAFELHGYEPGRVMPGSFQTYCRLQPRRRAPPPASIFGEDWIVLRRIDGPRLPSLRAVDVARTTRKALLAASGPSAPEILSGHGGTGGPSQRPHLACLPLPFVGSEHADGAILGVALVLPRGAGPEERRAVYLALANWERAALASGSMLDEETPRLELHLGQTGVIGLVRSEQDAQAATLRPRTWSAEAAEWASATPVALDHNPGELRSKDPRKEALAYAEAEASIATACERVGLPRPSRVMVLPAAPLAGAHKARAFPAFAPGKPPAPRVLVHARVSFDSPVRGPILLGAGRYLGLGFFRPVNDRG